LSIDCAAAKQLLKQFKQLIFAHEHPEMLPVPAEAGYARGDTNRENHLRFKRYYYGLLPAIAFMEASEKTIVEVASLEVLQQFYELKGYFIQLANLVKVSTEHPLDDGELIMSRSYYQLLKERLDRQASAA
jgi:hypothetical protein